jgi:hypothetical protein
MIKEERPEPLGLHEELLVRRVRARLADLRFDETTSTGRQARVNRDTELDALDRAIEIAAWGRLDTGGRLGDGDR